MPFSNPQQASDKLTLRCASVQVDPNPLHPNRIPFSGVLAKLDQPSDGAPHGTMGRRIVIPSALAAAISADLLLTPINVQAEMSGHDLKVVIGAIAAADVSGDDWIISGYLYGKNFPDEVAEIKALKDSLGFSIEMSQLVWENPFALGTLVLKAGVPTGASILLKKKAAYQSTSLAASKSEVNPMDPILVQLLAQMTQMQASQTETANLLKGLSASMTDAVSKLATFGSDIKSQLAEAKAPAAAVVEAPKAEVAAAADINSLLAQAIGAQVLQNMMASAAPAAAEVKPATATAAPATPVPAQQPDLLASLASLLMKPAAAVAAPTAEVAAAAEVAVQRQTLSSEAGSFLNRYSTEIAAGADGKYSVGSIDKCLDQGGYTALQGTGIKMSLRSAGLV